MARCMDKLRATFQASSDCLCMTRHSKKRSLCRCLDCTVGGYRSGEQSESLPVQIAISVELDWVSGRDSPATNPDIDLNRLAALTKLSQGDWSTEMIQARKQVR